MAKILIIRLTSLGDVIFTLPLVNTLKENGHTVGFLTSEKGINIIKNNPSIDKVHFFPLQKHRKNKFSISNIKETISLIKELRQEKYDIALDCQQMFKSLLLFGFCGAKRRITFSDARELSVLGGNEFIKPKFKFRDFNYHIVERNLDFARYINCKTENISFSLPKTSKESEDKVNELLSKTDKNKKTIVISPATTWKNKHWSVENWKQLLSYLNKKYNIIITGTKNDEKLVSDISENIDIINLTGKTNLEELEEVFKKSDLVISVDSGSSNLAWSCQKPALITIFTCTPSKRFGPYGSDKYKSIQGNLSCQPCFKKKCPNKNNICMNKPSVDEIIKNVNELLTKIQ